MPTAKRRSSQNQTLRTRREFKMIFPTIHPKKRTQILSRKREERSGKTKINLSKRRCLKNQKRKIRK